MPILLLFLLYFSAMMAITIAVSLWWLLFSLSFPPPVSSFSSLSLLHVFIFHQQLL